MLHVSNYHKINFAKVCFFVGWGNFFIFQPNSEKIIHFFSPSPAMKSGGRMFGNPTKRAKKPMGVFLNVREMNRLKMNARN